MFKTCIIDIEVITKNGEFPNVDAAKWPVNLITHHNNYNDEYITYVFKTNLKNETQQLSDNWILKSFNDESNLLFTFIKDVREMSPDIIVEYSFDGFDMPYLYNRCENLGIPLSEISPIKKMSMKKFGLEIGGIHNFNFYKADEKLKSRPSRKLEDVAQEELGVGKIKIDDWLDMYENQLPLFIKYNKRDVELCVRLNEKLKYIEYFTNIFLFAGLTDLSDTFHNSNVIDTVALRKAHEKNVILPSKPENVKKSANDDYDGGYVLTPPIGIFDNASVLDFSRFYPTIILSINASPEMISIDGDIVVDDVKFKSTEEGFIPSLVLDFFTERDKLELELNNLERGSNDYKLFNDRLQALKGVTNSLYGVMGHKRFRLYNIDVAKSITFVGRMLIMETGKIANNFGYKVKIIYTDTDSVFMVIYNENNILKLVEISEFISKKLNEAYKQITINMFNAKSQFTISFEKLFKTILFVGGKDKKTKKIVGLKKKYAGHVVYEKGQEADYIMIKGFETKKSNTSKLSKDLQKTVIEMIVYKKPTEEIKKYIKDQIDYINNDECDPEMVAIPQSINKNLTRYGGINKRGGKIGIPAHIRGSIWANTHLKTKFTSGSKPLMLYVKKVPQEMEKTDIVCFENKSQITEGFEIDRKIIIEKTIKMKIDKLIDLLGVSWEALVNNQKSIFDDFDNFVETSEPIHITKNDIKPVLKELPIKKKKNNLFDF